MSATVTEHLPNSYDSRRLPEAQQRSEWTAPTGVLGGLIRSAFVRAGELRARRRELERAAAAARPAPDFRAALTRPDVAIIAELKRASPSQGAINPGLDAAGQARAYAAGGAAAISVLTEPTQFGASEDDLESVSAEVSIPVLRKDFIVSHEQILETRALGAAAVLLIVRALEPWRLHELVELARDIGIEPLVEVHDPDELGGAVAAGAGVIGINNRDLETLEVKAATFERISQLVPTAAVLVAESGFMSRADVERAARAGAHAVLIGSALSAASDPAASVKKLTGVRRISV